MAFGFPASSSSRVDLNIPRGIAREAIRNTIDLLGWRYEVIDVDTFYIKVPMSALSWGERITLSLASGVLEIQSVCSYPLQFVDWGKNKKNVTQFLAIFEVRSIRYAKQANEGPQYFDSEGRTPIDRALKDTEFQTCAEEFDVDSIKTDLPKSATKKKDM